MVTVSPLEKISQVAKLSECRATSQNLGRDHKLHMGGENGNFGMDRTLSRSVTQNHKSRSDIYLDKVDEQLVGMIGAQDERSLFSSSLSDLVNHKLRLSENKLLSRPSSIITSQKDEKDPFESQEEIEGQTINSLLPDEEELFSGMVDEMGHVAHNNAIDDLEDFDVFTCGGGIELESDETSQAGQTNMGYPWGRHPNHNPVPLVDHSSRGFPIPRLPNGISHSNTSIHENSSIYNGFHQSPVRMSSIGNQFGIDETSRSFPKVHLDNRGIPNFHPHSPQLQLGSVNGMPRMSLDGMTGIADDIRPSVPENSHLDFRHLGLNGNAMDFGEGAFGYPPNGGIHAHQSVASKSNSYQQHQLRSLLMSNSGPFLNNNRPHHLGGLPGSPGNSHMMVNMGSPMHQLQVGSAPVIKASPWDRQQQVYGGESHEASGYHMSAIRGVRIPGFSAAHPQEISSHVNFPRITGAELSRNSGVHSPQQMSHMFHDRNPMNSLPTSFGSPGDRVRNRRNDTHLSHADKKHYELNIDRILRGDDSRTTLMIKNIPNKYTSKMLLATIDEQHRGKYDFIYLPIDFKNKCNMGYAFINMIDPLQIASFHQTFEGRKWEKFNSEKVATLAYARIQGKAALIAHFQNSSLMNEDKRCRPILFHTDGPNAGDQEPFPMGTNFRAKPGRSQATGDEEEE